MSALYCTITSDTHGGSKATRRAFREASVTLNGWNGGVTVEARRVADEIRFIIIKTGGSNGGSRETVTEFKVTA